MDRERKRWLIGCVGLALLGVVSFSMGRISAPSPGPRALPLPETVTRVKLVSEIQPFPVPNPLNGKMVGELRQSRQERRRLEQERAALVEQLRLATAPRDVPEPEIRVIRDVVERAADLNSLQVDVGADLEKHEGLAGDRLAWGWDGHLWCRIRAEEGDDWTELAREPVALDLSEAVSTLRPEPLRRPRTVDLRVGLSTRPAADLSVSWGRGRFRPYLGVQYDLDPESFAIEAGDGYDQQVFRFEADKLDIYAGVNLRLGRMR